MEGNIVNIISSVGFPIFICCALLWYIKILLDTHKEESKNFSDALNNNTLALQKLCDKLDNMEGGKE